MKFEVTFAYCLELLIILYLSNKHKSLYSKK